MSKCGDVEMGVVKQAQYSPTFMLIVAHTPCTDVTAYMKAMNRCDPAGTRLTGCLSAGPASGPAFLSAQIIVPRATIGTITALMLKIHLSLDGWMKMSGNWMIQKMKKDSMSRVDVPDPSGSWLPSVS